MSAAPGRPSRAELVAALPTAALPAGLAVATFLAATPWLRVFSLPGTVGLLAAAAMASVLIPFLAGRIWHQPPAVSYVASAVGCVVLLTVAAGPHPGPLWHALTTGPNQVLTETLPLGGTRALLAGPLLLTWLGGTVSAELLSRAPRSDSGLAAVGLAIPVASFVLAYAISASRPGPDRVTAPLLLLTLATVALLRRLPSSPGPPPAVVSSTSEERVASPWRPGVRAVAVAGIAVALAVAVPSLPHMSGRPAALNRHPPLATTELDDPLDAMAAWRDDNPSAPARTVLRMHTAQASNGYLAAVVLDDYDGGTWSFDATLRPTGGRIPAPAAETDATGGTVGLTTVRQAGTLLTPLPVPFLPALDRPVDASGPRIEADAATGMLMPDHPNGTTSYSVVSDVPQMTLASLSSADGIGAPAGQPVPGVGAVSPADLALPAGSAPALASALRFLASLAGRRPAPTVAFLQATLRGLHADERRLDPALPASAPSSVPQEDPEKGKPARPANATRPLPVRGSHVSGTSLAVVINAVTSDRRATPEQFATLYTMAARYLGVPARVVCGFRLAPASLAGPAPAGTYQVTNRQAWTWVEIPVAGVGWVVADPTPDAVAAPGPPPPQAVQATPTTLRPNQANAVPRSGITGAHAVAKPAPVAVSPAQPPPWWALVVAVLGGVLLMAALLGPGLAGARRIMRRRARRHRDPSRLAVGAWLELLDALQQAGMTSAPGDTAAEVATEAGRHFGPDLTQPVQEVGALANRAIFSLSGAPGQEDAQRAWASQHAVREAVHGRLDRRQRVRALLAVGSAPRHPSAAEGAGGRHAERH